METIRKTGSEASIGDSSSCSSVGKLGVEMPAVLLNELFHPKTQVQQAQQLQAVISLAGLVLP